MFNGSSGGSGGSFGSHGFGADPAHIQATFNVLAKNIAAKRKKNLAPAEMSALQQIVEHAYVEVKYRNARNNAPLSSQQEDDAARAILKTTASKFGILL